MANVTQTDLLTIDEYVRLYARDGAFEIINGEGKPLLPPVTSHGLTTRLLFRILDLFCLQNGLGEVFAKMPFVLTDDAGWVKEPRVPDVMFIAVERWRTDTEATPGWKDKPVRPVPELVVEVVSPNNLDTDLQDKVAHYIRDEVKPVWVIDPNRHTVAVDADRHFTQRSTDDVLDGGQVLPGLKINVKDLFE